MSGRLEGKVALVTGAAHGIGTAIAERFAAEGARVLATDLDRDGVRGVGADSRGHDVTSEADWNTVAAWSGQVDVLVNNAGVFLAARLGDTTLDEFRRIQEVNQVGVFLGMRTIAPLMVARGGGSIINLSSIAG